MKQIHRCAVDEEDDSNKQYKVYKKDGGREDLVCVFCFAWPLAGESGTSVRTRLVSAGASATKT